MEQSYSREADTCDIIKKFLVYYETHRFITAFPGTRHLLRSSVITVFNLVAKLCPWGWKSVFSFYLFIADQFREYGIGGACSMNGEKRSACKILVGKPEGRRPLGRPRCAWGYNIKMDLREIGWAGMYIRQGK
jgi:hypothetical protein